MGSRLLSFVVWATVAAASVFWVLRLLTRAPEAPARAVPVQFGTTASAADLARLLGTPPKQPVINTVVAPPSADSRFRLQGVVAARDARTRAGLALISVDGKPARAFGVGAALDDALVLISVDHRAVEIGPRGGPAQIKLELAAVPEAARSQFPSARTPAGASALPAVARPPPVAVPPPATVSPPLDLPPGMVVTPEAARANTTSGPEANMR
jgi:general secretion pathway protein C